MKSILFLLMAYLITSSAFAVVDPDPDMMGIYFDIDADENCLTIGTMTPFNAYAILTNPTIPAVSAYEFGQDVVVPAGMENMIFRLASNVGNGPSAGDDWGEHPEGDYIIGLPVPIPATPATILHSWQYMLLDVIPVEMYLHAPSTPSIPGDLPIVLNPDGNILMQVGLSTGGPDIPVATVNTDCVVGLEDVSFGSIKSIFR